MGCGFLWNCAPEELAYGPTQTGDASAGGGGSGGDAATSDATAWPEICGNGVDDDNNGKTDCEDPVCNEFACVPTAPAGWSGPYAVFAASPDTLPDCPDGLELVSDQYRDLRYSPSTCSACSCGNPTGLSCVATAALSATDCASLTTTESLTGSCTTHGLGATLAAVQVSFDANGSCGPGTQPTPGKDTPSWASGYRICKSKAPAAPAGCASGEVCAPSAAGAEACVISAGDTACPAAFPDRRLVYASQDDSRGCSACSCSFSGGCSGTVRGYSDAACGSQVFSVSAGCSATPNAQTLSMTTSSLDGSCVAGASTPNGCVLPATPTTMCCVAGADTCPSGKGPDMVRVPVAGGGSYCVDSTEVTNVQYADFLATSPAPPTLPECAFKSNLTPGSTWPDPDLNEPVNFVDWCDAYAYCAWAGKRLCGAVGGGPVPTSAVATSAGQWYGACSAGGSLEYAYGDQVVNGICATTVVNVKASPCCQGPYSDLYDMIGFMREWVDSCTGTSGGSDNCFTMGRPKCTSNQAANRSQRNAEIGFRCCAP